MTEANELRGRDKRTIRTTEGLVERIDETYVFYNTFNFKFGDDWCRGVFFVIKDSEGLIQRAKFPREFSLPEKNAIVGNYIVYQFTRDSVYKGNNTFLNRFIYELEVRNGPYRGWKIEKIVCFDTKNEEEKY